ncbi:MAG TPA: YtxH domain-containing protein [Vicinamibacterales bacterium]|jgi:gas vesicle protein
MNTQQQDHRADGRAGYGFAIGLFTGAFVGAGLALWFAPRLTAELRERVTGSARDLGQRVTDHYDHVTTRIANAATEVTRQGQDVRDDVADAVAHAAHEVERFAKAAKTR